MHCLSQICSNCACLFSLKFSVATAWVPAGDKPPPQAGTWATGHEGKDGNLLCAAGLTMHIVPLIVTARPDAGTSIVSICECGNQGSKRFSHLPKTTQLVRGGVWA